jgi:hypothetical protein
MIIYNVTVSLADETIHDEWLQWMKKVHVPQVMETELFADSKMLRLLNEENNGITYAIQYRCLSLAHYERYLNEFAPILQAETAKRYGNKVLAFRTLLEEV